MLLGPILIIAVLSSAFSELMKSYEGVDTFTVGYRTEVTDNAMLEATKLAGEEAGILFYEYPEGEIKDIMQKNELAGFLELSGDSYTVYTSADYTPEHLKQMIKSVYNGTGVMEDTILENLAKNSDTKANCFCEDGYTAREIDIIKAVAEGLSNKEIASKLFISEGTVKNYITSILAKENLSHRTALAVYYLTAKSQVEKNVII